MKREIEKERVEIIRLISLRKLTS